MESKEDLIKIKTHIFPKSLEVHLEETKSIAFRVKNFKPNVEL